MELRQLEYLVAVADEGGFTRAADWVRVAQPGVSAQVRRLERELGEDLIDRSGRRMRPTAVGEAVLPYARAALAGAAGVRRAVEEMRGLVRGRVAIGTMTSFAGLDVAALLAAFHRDFPEVEIVLSQGPSEGMLQALADGRLDLALVGAAGPPPEGIAARTVLDEELVVAVAPGDRLARRRSVAAAALAGRGLILLAPGTGIRASVDAVLARAGVAPRVVAEAADPAMLADLAAAGLGVAILPASLVAGRGPALRGVPLAPALRGRLELAWREGGPAGPAARELIARARAAAEALAPSGAG